MNDGRAEPSSANREAKQRPWHFLPRALLLIRWHFRRKTGVEPGGRRAKR